MRLKTIDALRGIASIYVVIFHMYLVLGDDMKGWLPDFFSLVFAHGYTGVDIFFVISGFVIALSNRVPVVNAKYILNFAFRRSIRLDPPYWVALATEILLIYISARIYPELKRNYPSLHQLGWHLLYMQNVMGYENIVAVYWTLCLEVQFYLVYIFVLGLFGKFAGFSVVRDDGGPNYWLIIPFYLITVYSILCSLNWVPQPYHGSFLTHWFEFFLGVVICWCIFDQLTSRYFWAYILLISCTLLVKWNIGVAVGIVTAVFIYIVGSLKKYDSVLAWRPLLYFGSISYSLYLIHGSTGRRLILLGKNLIGGPLNMFESIILFLSGILVSIVAAHLLYTYVERISVVFSKRFKLKNQPVK